MNCKKIAGELEDIAVKSENLSGAFSYVEKFDDSDFSALMNILKSYVDEINSALGELKERLEDSVDNSKDIPLWDNCKAKGFRARLAEDNSGITVFDKEGDVYSLVNLKNLVEAVIKKSSGAKERS